MCGKSITPCHRVWHNNTNIGSTGLSIYVWLLQQIQFLGGNKTCQLLLLDCFTFEVSSVFDVLAFHIVCL